MAYLKIKKRCIRCRQYLRAEGTCQNAKCVRYTPDKTVTSEDSTKDTENSAEA